MADNNSFLAYIVGLKLTLLDHIGMLGATYNNLCIVFFLLDKVDLHTLFTIQCRLYNTDNNHENILRNRRIFPSNFEENKSVLFSKMFKDFCQCSMHTCAFSIGYLTNMMHWGNPTPIDYFKNNIIYFQFLNKGCGDVVGCMM